VLHNRAPEQEYVPDVQTSQLSIVDVFTKYFPAGQGMQKTGDNLVIIFEMFLFPFSALFIRMSVIISPLGALKDLASPQLIISLLSVPLMRIVRPKDVEKETLQPK